jgi:hypothetical protein
MLKGQEDVKKLILKFAVWTRLKTNRSRNTAISGRWAVGKQLGSKIKSRKLKEIDFFTSSRRSNHHPKPDILMRPDTMVVVPSVPVLSMSSRTEPVPVLRSSHLGADLAFQMGGELSVPLSP